MAHTSTSSDASQRSGDASRELVWVNVEEVDTNSTDRDRLAVRVTFQSTSWTVNLVDPWRYKEKESERLEWYFESHFLIPEIESTRAKLAETAIRDYGENLYLQLFDPDSCPLQPGSDEQDKLAFSISGRRAHGLYWEALACPTNEVACSTATAVVRRTARDGRTKCSTATRSGSRLTINVLLVLSRPYKDRDVASNVISKPLYEILQTGKAAKYFRYDIVRPGTFAALLEHLRLVNLKHGKGFYDVIHFDLHGAVMTGHELSAVLHPTGHDSNQGIVPDDARSPVNNNSEGHAAMSKAFLFFTPDPTSKSTVDAIEANRVADLIQEHEIPVAIFNSCQSGKEVAKSEANLARILYEKGCDVVIGMSFSFTATAASIFMTRLYQSLIQGMTIDAAVTSGRRALCENKDRSAGGKTFRLDDWMLPVVFCRDSSFKLDVHSRLQSVQTNSIKFQPKEFMKDQRTGESVQTLSGRDADILAIEEKMLTRSRTLVLEGAPGIGKTKLAEYLCWWWKNTNLVDEHVIFDFRQALDTPFNSIHSALSRLMVTATEVRASEDLIVEEIFRCFSQQRMLLVMDSLEYASEIMSQAELGNLRKLLRRLGKTSTLIILVSQGVQQDNILARTFDKNIHHLDGLEYSGILSLVTTIIESLPTDRRPSLQAEFSKLIDQLDGNPLAIQVVLGSLEYESCKDLVLDLQAGSSRLPPSLRESNNRLLMPIRAAFMSLPASRKALLLCFAPFSNHLDRSSLGLFASVLRKRSSLNRVKFEDVPQLLGFLSTRGLLKLAHQHLDGRLLLLNPMLTTFLRAELQTESGKQMSSDINEGCIEFLVTLAEETLIERSSIAGDLQLIKQSVFIDFYYEYFFGALRAVIQVFHQSSAAVLTLLCNHFYRSGKLSECYNVASTALALLGGQPPTVSYAKRDIDIASAYFWAGCAASALNWDEEASELFQRLAATRDDVSSRIEASNVEEGPLASLNLKMIDRLCAESLKLKGSKALQLGDVETSRRHFASASDMLAPVSDAANKDWPSIIVGYCEQGHELLGMNRIPAGRLLLDQAIKLHDEHGSRLSQQDAWVAILTLADIEGQLGEYESAESKYEKALAMLSPDKSSILNRALVLVNMGALEGKRGRPYAAAKWSRSALETLEKHVVTQPSQVNPEIARYRGAAYHSIAASMLTQGLAEEARGMLNDSLLEKEKSNLVPEMAVSYQALGSLDLSQGDLVSAAMNYRKGLESCDQGAKQANLEALLLRSCGYLLLDAEDPIGAREMLQRSLDIELHPSGSIESGRLVTQGSIAETFGDVLSAERLLQLAAGEYACGDLPDDSGKWCDTTLRLARLSLCLRDVSMALMRYWYGVKILLNGDVPDLPSSRRLSAVKAALLRVTFLERDEALYQACLRLDSSTVDYGRLMLEYRPHRFEAVSTYNLAQLLFCGREWRMSAVLICHAVSNDKSLREDAQIGAAVDSWLSCLGDRITDTAESSEPELCERLGSAVCDKLSSPRSELSDTIRSQLRIGVDSVS